MLIPDITISQSWPVVRTAHNTRGGVNPGVAHNSVILGTARVEVGGGRDLCSSVSFVLDIVAGGHKVPVQTTTSTSHGCKSLVSDQ